MIMGKNMPVREANATESRRSFSRQLLSGRALPARKIGMIGLTLACSLWMVLLSPKAISGLPVASASNRQGPAKASSLAISQATHAPDPESEVATTEVPALTVPPGLKVSPSQAEMAVGKTLNFRLLDQNGHPVPGATWMVSDFTVAELDSVEPARIAAVAPGQVTVTAMLGDQALRATVTVVKPSPTLASAGRASGQLSTSR
jgi:uncharacterized protein YjdB